MGRRDCRIVPAGKQISLLLQVCVCVCVTLVHLFVSLVSCWV